MPRPAATILLAALALSGCAGSRAVPFTIEGGLPMVAGTANGIPVRILLDTGLSDACCLSQDQAQRFGITATGPAGTATLGDGSQISAVYGTEPLRIELGDVTMVVRHPVILQDRRNALIALGTACFVDGRAGIDYAARRVTFHAH